MSAKPDPTERLRNRLDGIRLKARLEWALRRFFHDEGFIEVTPPVRITAPAPEDHIEAPKADGGRLRSSPELQLKKLVAAGLENVFALASCFRKGESGRLHHEEFTMLEWYAAGSDYRTLMTFAAHMLSTVAKEVIGHGRRHMFHGFEIDFSAPWRLETVANAFATHAGTSPEQAIEQDLFETLLVEKVEPALSRNVPCALIDYPAAMAALARLKPDDPSTAERWELYLGGVEIANAYTELSDPAEQRRRFNEANIRRTALGFEPYLLDEEFLACLGNGPSALFAGCALGVDRLAMVMADADTIDDVSPSY